MKGQTQQGWPVSQKFVYIFSYKFSYSNPLVTQRMTLRSKEVKTSVYDY